MSANVSRAAVASDYTTVVEQLYLSYFGRPADPVGLKNFSEGLARINAPTTLNGINSTLHSNAALNAMVNDFGTSSESTQLYGGDTVAFVSAIYSNVLNRIPDYNGMVFWAGEINAGRLSKPEAALAIADGAMALGSIDAAVLNNKTIISSNFTAALDTALEVMSYVGMSAASLTRDMLKTVTATTNPALFDFSEVIAILIRAMAVPYSANQVSLAGPDVDMIPPGHEAAGATLTGGDGSHDGFAVLIGMPPAIHHSMELMPFA